MHINNPPSLSFHLPKPQADVGNYILYNASWQFCLSPTKSLRLVLRSCCHAAVIGEEQGMSLFDGLSVSVSLSRVAFFTLLYGATCEQSSVQRFSEVWLRWRMVCEFVQANIFKRCISYSGCQHLTSSSMNMFDCHWSTKTFSEIILWQTAYIFVAEIMVQLPLSTYSCSMRKGLFCCDHQWQYPDNISHWRSSLPLAAIVTFYLACRRVPMSSLFSNRKSLAPNANTDIDPEHHVKQITTLILPPPSTTIQPIPPAALPLKHPN